MSILSPNPQSTKLPVYQHPVELLQHLIRFDTTNPPGNEGPCIAYIRDLLGSAGIETTILARDPARPNLVARLPGQGHAPPLLLYGHVDVVTTAGQAWQHPPFSGDMVDGYVWGRGALDMKGGVAMMLAAVLRARAEGLSLPGDVVLAVLSDEEERSDYGAGFLVKEHAGLFAGIRYALGEFGGFSFHVGKRRLRPIQVAEKQLCWMKATLRGPGGHGAMPVRGGAMAKLAQVLHELDRRQLPVHVTPVVRQMIGSMAAALPFPSNFVVRLLLRPRLTDRVLPLLGEQGRLFAALLHNTVSPTGVLASDKINVIPSQVVLRLDGRLLPGYTPADLFAELRQLIGEEAELDLIRYDPGPPAPDMTLFDTLAGVLRELDPAGIPVPYVLSGVTDGSFFSHLGIQTYGFTPMDLPPGFEFWQLAHGADERIPADAVVFGTEAIYKALQRFNV